MILFCRKQSILPPFVSSSYSCFLTVPVPYQTDTSYHPFKAPKNPKMCNRCSISTNSAGTRSSYPVSPARPTLQELYSIRSIEKATKYCTNCWKIHGGNDLE